MEIVERIKMFDVRLKASHIWYSAHTCWWTHDPTHLSLLPPASEADIKRFAEQLRRNSGKENAPLDLYLSMARNALKSHRLPCDPRGSVLFETDDVQGYLNKAAENPSHYGKHGLRAFMAAHHSNSQKSVDDPSPWCETEWAAYNEALDRLDERKLAEKRKAEDET